ncbi:MAG: uroporphyrinogen-III C-methyltransferase [Opitutae bacterium]|nr:uroporphyrinogen-III C-methyltransferase [Opitutae bacterium]
MTEELMYGDAQSFPGFVWLVGAGPGATDLITVRGLRLLQAAEAVVCDDLVDPGLLQNCPAACERHFVGKRAGCHSASQSQINALLVARASAGQKVVRLKGGDPLVFGRAGEEMQALREAGIPYEIVPGVTAATAAAAAAGLPLTHREHSSAVVFVTGHQCAASTAATDWSALARLRATLCFYMGVRRLPEIAANLTAHGMAADMPLAVISEAARPAQQILTGTLRDAEKLSAGLIGQPALVVVGEVVRLASFAATVPALRARANPSVHVLR